MYLGFLRFPVISYFCLLFFNILYEFQIFHTLSSCFLSFQISSYYFLLFKMFSLFILFKASPVQLSRLWWLPASPASPVCSLLLVLPVLLVSLASIIAAGLLLAPLGHPGTPQNRTSETEAHARACYISEAACASTARNCVGPTGSRCLGGRGVTYCFQLFHTISYYFLLFQAAPPHTSPRARPAKQKCAPQFPANHCW